MTPTEQDYGLFELCKQVYEATGWKYTIGRFHDDGSYDGYVGHKGVAYTPNPQDAEWLPKNIPLYTSDYLLEKLSVITDYVSVKRSNKISIDASNDEKGNWYAHYWFKSRRVQVKSDTPLKALLKLTIALDDAGVKL